MTELSCMTFLQKDGSQTILVAGCQNPMYKIDTEKGQIVKRITASSHYTMMRYNRYVCAATSSGAVDFLDPVTLHVVKTWQAHTAKINSMDAKNDFLITCGWSTRPYGHSPSLDTLAKVFDMKNLEQLAPISFHAGAAFVQIHPKMSTTSVVSSQNGQIHVTDIVNADNVKMLHVTLTSSLVALIMSPSGNVWAIADHDNVISIWGSLNNLQFCDLPNPIEFADEITPVPHMSVDANLYVKICSLSGYQLIMISIARSVLSACPIIEIDCYPLMEMIEYSRLDSRPLPMLKFPTGHDVVLGTSDTSFQTHAKYSEIKSREIRLHRPTRM